MLVRKDWAPKLLHMEQGFGQMHLRLKPHSALLTRYLVLCRNTGALG